MEVRKCYQRWLVMVSLILLVSVGVFSKPAAAEGETMDVSVSRAEGTCTVNVSGLDAEKKSKVTVEVADQESKEVKYTKEYTAESDTLSESFTLDDLEGNYAVYSVTVKADDAVIGESKTCDFSIHTNKTDLSVNGENYSAKRTFSLNSTESSGGVLVPGTGNKVALYVWKGSSEESAEQLGEEKALGSSSVQWENQNISAVSSVSYGEWKAKAVLIKDSRKITLAAGTYTVEPKATSFVTKKTTALEKKQAFRIQLKGIKNPYGVNKISFYIYSSANKKITAVAAVKSGSTYKADVKYKTVKYKLEKLLVKAVIFDNKGKNRTLSKTANVDLSVKAGKTKVKKNNDVTCDYILTGAYLPGNIKKVQFVVYLQKGDKLVKQKTYTGTGSVAKKRYSVNAEIKKTGTYTVYTFAYTAWGKKIRLATTEYTITKKDMGKQGWYYEKVNGKTYKFYYKDNEKVTDLTNILKLSKNGSNKMYIEVNRAAAVVTFYLYDTKTKKYDIPIKSATVSVGRDVRTVAGAGALNIHSSFTPIGSYSVCSNGAAVRYPLKPMHEPDGSTVYARWCTHIVGNVYFHAIAVGAQSHYALSARSYNKLGGPASAGCIRMTVADAKWLYTYAPTGTQVKIVVGSSSKPGPFGKPATIKISGVNYDPTDPEVPDSRKKADYKAKKISGYMTKKGVKVGY